MFHVCSVHFLQGICKAWVIYSVEQGPKMEKGSGINKDAMEMESDGMLGFGIELKFESE